MAALVNSGFSDFTLRTTPALTYPSIASNGTILVAVSWDGDTSPVLTSTDGVTWTQRAAGLAAHLWNDVIWVEDLSLFVAVSDPSGETTNVMTSANGITWVARTAPDTAWVATAWNGTTLVAVSYNNSNNVMTSTDGITWAAQTSSGLSAGADDLAFGNGVFVSCNVGGGISSSANGIAWTLRETPTATSCRGRVVWSAALASFFVLASTSTGSNGGALYASADGITWARQEFDALPMQNPDVLFVSAAGILLVADASGTDYLTSDDGLTWTADTFQAGDWYGGVWDDTLGIIALVGTDGATTDVQTATYATVPAVTGLDYLEGETICVVGDGITLASPNNPAYDPIVVTSGTATLPAGTYSTVSVGLPITADLQTLDLDNAGTSRKDAAINIVRIGLWLEDSKTPFAGKDEPATDAPTDLQQMPQTDEDGTVTTSLISGYREVNIDGAFTNHGRIFLRQVDPQPLTVLSIIPQGTFGRS